MAGRYMETLDEYRKLIKSCPEEELEGILRNIDKEKYRDRYEFVCEELKRREIERSQKDSLEKETTAGKPYPPWPTDTVLEIIVGVFFFSFIIEIFLGTAVAFIPGFLVASSDTQSVVYSVYRIIKSFILDGLILYIIYRFLKYYKLSFREGLRLQRIPNMQVFWIVIGGIFTALCVILLGMFEAPIPGVPVKDIIVINPAFILFVLFAITAAPVVEEIFFRGYVYPALERSRGMAQAVIITSLAFGIVHIPQLWGMWISVILICIGGFILTLIRALTKSTLASIFFHFTYNFSIFMIKGLAFLFSGEGGAG